MNTNSIYPVYYSNKRILYCQSHSVLYRSSDSMYSILRSSDNDHRTKASGVACGFQIAVLYLSSEKSINRRCVDCGFGFGFRSAFSKALSHPDPFAMPFTAVTITIGPLEKSAIGVWS